MSDILICHRNRSFAESLEAFLAGCGYTVQVSDVGSRGIQKVLSGSCGVVVVGVHVTDTEGLEMIPVVHQVDRQLPVVAVGDEGSLEMERKARLAKVFYYMVQPVDFDELKKVVSRALQGQEDPGRAQR